MGGQATRATTLLYRFDATKSDGGADLRTFGALMAAGAVVVPFTPPVGVLCPLRRLTGIPCPLCGMTTGTLALSRGDIVGSVAANPFAIVLVTALVVSFLPVVYRAGWFQRAWRRVKPVAPMVPFAMMPLLWVWQLARFDFI